ncbi:MAG TPA: NDP-sugar synthase, partial [Actinomycetaceae bacterium]|nr:NDP-sugar synthase [Actinomycetaceae bacterium]
DLAAQIEQHRTADADVTLYLTRVDDPRDYGSVPTEGERVVAFREKSPEPISDQVNAGCYVFRRSLLDAIPAGKVVSVERETFPELLDAGRRVLGHVSDAYWRDLGTPESYLQGCVDVVLGRVDAPARPGPPGQRLVLDNAEVHQGATVDGGSFVGSGARIGSQAVVHASVVLDDAIVGEGAQITRSVIGEWATVGAGAVLDGAMVVDGYEVPAGLSPDVGARLS